MPFLKSRRSLPLLSTSFSASPDSDETTNDLAWSSREKQNAVVRAVSRMFSSSGTGKSTRSLKKKQRPTPSGLGIGFIKTDGIEASPFARYSSESPSPVSPDIRPPSGLGRRESAINVVLDPLLAPHSPTTPASVGLRRANSLAKSSPGIQKTHVRTPTTPSFGMHGPVFVSKSASKQSFSPHLIPRSPICHEPDTPDEDVAAVTISETLYSGLRPASAILPLLYSRSERKKIVFGTEVDKRTVGQVLKAFGKIIGGDAVEDFELVLEDDGVTSEALYKCISQLLPLLTFIHSVHLSRTYPTPPTPPPPPELHEPTLRSGTESPLASSTTQGSAGFYTPPQSARLPVPPPIHPPPATLAISGSLVPPSPISPNGSTFPVSPDRDALNDAASEAGQSTTFEFPLPPAHIPISPPPSAQLTSKKRFSFVQTEVVPLRTRIPDHIEQVGFDELPPRSDSLFPVTRDKSNSGSSHTSDTQKPTQATKPPAAEKNILATWARLAPTLERVRFLSGWEAKVLRAGDGQFYDADDAEADGVVEVEMRDGGSDDEYRFP